MSLLSFAAAAGGFAVNSEKSHGDTLRAARRENAADTPIPRLATSECRGRTPPQRSRRAGRSGHPALVAAFCSEGSPHDQYFFRNPDAMVAGAVAPPRLDLSNEDLVRAHIQSVWLAATRINLRQSMAEVLDLDSPGFLLEADILHRTELSEAKAAQLRAEFFNVLNHPNRANPFGSANGFAQNDASAPSTFRCGCATVDVAASNPVLGSGGNRSIQLGLKLVF